MTEGKKVMWKNSTAWAELAAAWKYLDQMWALNIKKLHLSLDCSQNLIHVNNCIKCIDTPFWKVGPNTGKKLAPNIWMYIWINLVTNFISSLQLTAHQLQWPKLQHINLQQPDVRVWCTVVYHQTKALKVYHELQYGVDANYVCISGDDSWFLKTDYSQKKGTDHQEQKDK